MPIRITWTHSSGLNESFTYLDDDGVQRIIQWAKTAYPSPPNEDGTIPPTNNVQACRRATQSWINGMKDATRKSEHDKNVADVPEPPPISVVEPPA